MTGHEQSLVDLATTTGAPYGLSAAVVLQEARRVLFMPDPEPRACFADLYARLTAAEALELDKIRARHGRILRCGMQPVLSAFTPPWFSEAELVHSPRQDILAHRQFWCTAAELGHNTVS